MDEIFTWPKNIQNAKAIQISLRDKVRISPLKKTPRYVAAVDAAFFDSKIVAVACVCKYPELVCEGHETRIKEAAFPYVPGYLTFREGPAIVEVFLSLKIKPDLILVDGQGIAHPKGIGIASHLGVILNIPTIGCAKSRLVGEYREPGYKKGDWSPLEYDGRTVGAVLRTRDDVRPLFVSPGHKIDLRGSIEIVLGCVDKYRIPEPLRIADSLSKKIRKESMCDKGLT